MFASCFAKRKEPLEPFSEKAPAVSGLSIDTLSLDSIKTLPLPDSVLSILEEEIDALSAELRTLSLDIHDHPETGFKEHHTSKLLSDFVEDHGFSVTRKVCGLDTAFSAEFSTGKGPVIGFNSEMDALPFVGHACGHNLIAIAGVAAALSVARALVRTKTPGKVILLGTPAEEGGGGKIILLERGAYKGMDACLMTHPAPVSNISTTLAIATIDAKFIGHTAHGAGAPWDGVNALDGAVLAYNAISCLRQQIHPDERIGIVLKGSENWASNVITGEASVSLNFRSANIARLRQLRPRVINALKGAAVASGTKLELNVGLDHTELLQNSILATDYVDYLENRLGVPHTAPENLGSTDFGNVTYALPGLHPAFKIPTVPGGANHTPEFTESAGTKEAHVAALNSAKGLAVIGFRVVSDSDYRRDVTAAFKKSLQK